MVKIRYKGTGITFARTAGGLVHTFKPNMVYEFDETHKRFAPFVEKLLKNSAFEVQPEVGPKGIGAGVSTRSKTSGTKKEEVKAKPKAKPKKGKGLKKPKGKAK